MIRLTIRNLLANRARFVMTTFAVVLAVAFVVSSFVVADGARSSFGKLSEDLVAGVDMEVRPVGENPPVINDKLLESVASVDGVAAVSPVLSSQDGDLRPINHNNEALRTNGPPQITFAWPTDSRLSRITLVEGFAPAASNEFAMDLDSAENNGFAPGETYRVITADGPIEMVLTGTFSFGDTNDTLGAALMAMPVDGLLDILDREGYDAIAVGLQDPAEVSAVEAAIEALSTNSASGLAVIGSQDLVAEAKQGFSEEVDIIRNVLLGFAGVSVFVSVFIIYNTFAIVLSQRTRELALLRVVGTDPRQLRRSVLTEALVVAVLASLIGIGAGLLLAHGLESLFTLLGAPMPDFPLVLTGKTAAIGLGVGVVATLASAVGPAVRAAKTAPMAALRDDTSVSASRGRVRLVAGCLLLAVGLVAGGTGLFVASSTTSVAALLGLGGVCVFLGTAIVSHLLTAPVTRLFGLPAKGLGGVSGRLARDNSARNPQRTATTSAALMVGLALVSTALMVGESVKSQFRDTLNDAVIADYIVTDQQGNANFPPTLAEDLDNLAETDALAAFSYDGVYINGSSNAFLAAGADLSAVDTLFDLGLTAGVGYDPNFQSSAVVNEASAEEAGIEVGDTITVGSFAGIDAEVTVIGLFTQSTVMDAPFLIHRPVWSALDADPALSWVAFDLVDGVTPAQAEAALQPNRAAYPHADFATSAQFIESVEVLVDQMITMVNAMVSLAVVIAFIGIANTLALSILERTRELGLLRAVGMSRRQVRTMVRSEAALIALFGAVLGVTLGVGFGWATVVALPNEITSVVSVPVGRISVLVAVAIGAALVAAIGPARRAARLDPLQAITT